MMTISTDRADCLRQMTEAFEFIEELAGNDSFLGQERMRTGPGESLSNEIHAVDVISTLRFIYKIY